MLRVCAPHPNLPPVGEGAWPSVTVVSQCCVDQFSAGDCAALTQLLERASLIQGPHHGTRALVPPHAVSSCLR
jgi:hypothetical protein